MILAVEIESWADVGWGMAFGVILTLLALWLWMHANDLWRSIKFKRMAHEAEMQRAMDKRLSGLHIIGADPLLEGWTDEGVADGQR